MKKLSPTVVWMKTKLICEVHSFIVKYADNLDILSVQLNSIRRQRGFQFSNIYRKTVLVFI